MAGQTVTVRFLGDTKNLDRALASTQKKTGAFGVAAGIGIAGAAVAVKNFAVDSVKSFAEAEKSQVALQSAFAKFPALADTNIGALEELASARAQVTKFDDDATKAAMANMAQFGLTGKQIAAVTPLVQDYAAKTGKALPDAATAVGKALMGNTRALKEIGINYKATGDRAKDAAAIQALLAQQVGGFAEREGKSAAGQAQILANQFGELKEAVGARLVPALMTMGQWLQKIIGWVQQNQAWIKPLVVVLGTAAAAIAVIVGAVRAWAAAQAILNVVLTANPIGIVIVAIAALVAGIVYAWNHCEGFRNVVKKVWDAIKLAFQVGVAYVKAVLKAGWDVLKKIFSYTPLGIITQNFGKIVAFFKGLPEKLRTVLSNVANVLKWPFVTAFNFIARAWNNTVGKLSFSVPDWVPVIGGKRWDVPDLPTVALAKGGIVNRPTLALIGESGPEAVVPLRGRTPLGQTVVNIHINGPVTDPVAAARWMRDAVLAGRRAGITF